MKRLSGILPEQLANPFSRNSTQRRHDAKSQCLTHEQTIVRITGHSINFLPCHSFRLALLRLCAFALITLASFGKRLSPVTFHGNLQNRRLHP
jgi:hypothetical protein